MSDPDETLDLGLDLLQLLAPLASSIIVRIERNDKNLKWERGVHVVANGIGEVNGAETLWSMRSGFVGSMYQALPTFQRMKELHDVETNTVDLDLSVERLSQDVFGR